MLKQRNITQSFTGDRKIIALLLLAVFIIGFTDAAYRGYDLILLSMGHDGSSLGVVKYCRGCLCGY